MKKKLKLKPFVIPTLYTTFAIVTIISLFLSIEVTEEKDNLTYVSSAILNEYVPVVNVVEDRILRPYIDNGVTVLNSYYKYNSSAEEQQSSIILYDNTYIQNTGINYSSENTFEVISILDGEVIEVKEEELLGKTITIRHDNDLISVYQSLGEVAVNVGDRVVTGQYLGKSGSCDLIKTSKNNLHFELYVSGTIQNPEDYYDKKVGEF